MPVAIVLAYVHRFKGNKVNVNCYAVLFVYAHCKEGSSKMSEMIGVENIADSE